MPPLEPDFGPKDFKSPDAPVGSDPQIDYATKQVAGNVRRLLGVGYAPASDGVSDDLGLYGIEDQAEFHRQGELRFGDSATGHGMYEDVGPLYSTPIARKSDADETDARKAA